MKIAVSSDARTHLVDAILEDLGKRGHEVEYLGPEPGKEVDWPVVTLKAAERVAQGAADEAIVMCWTGTGATLAANKVPGVRAALCHDAETAKGARIWNHANVLGLSLRATPEAVAKEILSAWFETPFSNDEWNLCQMQRIRETERKYGGLGSAETGLSVQERISDPRHSACSVCKAKGKTTGLGLGPIIRYRAVNAPRLPGLLGTRPLAMKGGGS